MDVAPLVTIDLEFMLALAALLAVVPALVACAFGGRLTIPVALSFAFALAGVVLVAKTAFPAFCGIVVWLGGSLWTVLSEKRKRACRGRAHEVTTRYLD